MAHVLGHEAGAKLMDFSPYGYDERQYCSPGFNLPVGMFQRSVYGTFPEYHTSADNLDFIDPEHLADSFRILTDVIDIVEGDWTPLNLFPKCEPQLGRRGLYAALGGQKSQEATSMSLLWVLNLADGKHSLLSIAERSGLPFRKWPPPPSCCRITASWARRAKTILDCREHSPGNLFVYNPDYRLRLVTTAGWGMTAEGKAMSSTFVAKNAAGYEPLMGRWSRRLAQPFLDFSDLRNCKRILDVGCGTGSLSKAIC